MVPAEHVVQEPRPVPEEVPAAHAVHCVDDVPDANVPAAHGL